MSRTRRRRPHGKPGKDRDGSGRPEGLVHSDDFAKEVQRRDRRDREAEAGKLARGDIDPHDMPANPVRLRLWQLWRRW
jgi:hypothetical protein